MIGKARLDESSVLNSMPKRQVTLASFSIQFTSEWTLIITFVGLITPFRHAKLVERVGAPLSEDVLAGVHHFHTDDACRRIGSVGKGSNFLGSGIRRGRLSVMANSRRRHRPQSRRCHRPESRRSHNRRRLRSLSFSA